MRRIAVGGMEAHHIVTTVFDDASSCMTAMPGGAPGPVSERQAARNSAFPAHKGKQHEGGKQIGQGSYNASLNS